MTAILRRHNQYDTGPKPVRLKMDAVTPPIMGGVTVLQRMINGT